MWDISVKKTVGEFQLDATLQTDAQRCVIIGGSGTGKTLFLKIIAGMIKPDEGYVSIAERNLDNVDMAQRKVAYLFQDYALFSHLTVAQQVAFSTRKGWFNPSRGVKQNKQVKDWLQALEIAHLADYYPWQLSGGQQQRTALARLLISNPNVLLLDEPFAALDTTLRDQMRHLINDWQRRLQLPMLIITHDPDDAQVFGDDVWQMIREDNYATLQQISMEKAKGHDSRWRLLDSLVLHETRHDNLSMVANETNMTLTAVHQGIDTLNNFAGTTLIQRIQNGYQITDAGRQWLQNYKLASGRQQRFMTHLSYKQQEALMGAYWRTSARNQLRGRISAIEIGAVNTQVVLMIGNGQLLTAIISKESAARLALEKGMEVIALINASDVMLATQSLEGVLSARNQLSGEVLRIEKGVVNDEVMIDLGDGMTLASVITRDSVEQLGIVQGQTIYALVKSPNVMLATLPL